MKKLVTYYFLFLASLFIFLSSGVVDSQDGFQYVEVARNLYYHGEPTGPVYKYDTRENIFMATHLGKDGKTYSNVGLGFSMAMLPAVAITDVIYKIYNITPPVNFPLENDWLILLTASFTNAFIAALLGVVLFLYLVDLGLSKKQSLLISFAGLLTTNLLVYAKYTFAHMMFVTFLLLACFLIRKHFQTKRLSFLLLAGLSYGVTVISYNQTFVLTILPVIIYFIFLSKFSLKLRDKKLFSEIKQLFFKLVVFGIGVLPLLLTYLWYENLRSGVSQNLSNPTVLASRGLDPLAALPAGVFLEGLFGQLFSPGRSIFLYSPILLLILIFWHKIKRAVAPELAIFLSLSAVYILFYAAQYSVGSAEQGIAGLWHGESSWGPRYLLPLIPFGLLIAGFIYRQLSNKQKLWIVLPLLLAGFYVQMLGSLMPYQIKYHDLQDKFFVNSTEFTNFTYGNLIPRFSPVFMMSKKLVKLGQSLPATLNHGEYNVKFYDGIDFPFPVGGERWRVVDKKGFIAFDNLEQSPVQKISLDLINHPIEEASYSATVQISVNDNLLKEEQFLPEERKVVEADIPSDIVSAKDNQLIIDVKFKSLKDGTEFSEINYYKDNPELYTDKTVQPKKSVSQILSIISLGINGQVINKESLDFPYVSALGPAITGKPYQNYGNLNSDPWKTWEIHTQIYERVPDFWWFKFLYYWDVPKSPLLTLWIFIVSIIVWSGFKTYKNLEK